MRHGSRPEGAPLRPFVRPFRFGKGGFNRYEFILTLRSCAEELTDYRELLGNLRFFREIVPTSRRKR